MIYSNVPEHILSIYVSCDCLIVIGRVISNMVLHTNTAYQYLAKTLQLSLKSGCMYS
jgi:hypothetical protein